MVTDAITHYLISEFSPDNISPGNIYDICGTSNNEVCCELQSRTWLFLAFSENTLFHVIEQLGLRDQSLFQ